MDIKRLLLGILLTLLAACESTDSRAAEGAKLTLRIQNNAQKRIYQDGFTCFVGVLDTKGIISVPLRYDMSPRRGFMDAVHLERRVQDPVFWAEDGALLSYETFPPIESFLIGHRKVIRGQLPGPWTVVKLDNSTLLKDADGTLVLNIEAFMTAPTESDELKKVFEALEAANRQFLEISDKEP